MLRIDGYSKVVPPMMDSPVSRLITEVEAEVFDQLIDMKYDIAYEIACQVRRALIAQSKRNLVEAIRNSYL